MIKTSLGILASLMVVSAAPAATVTDKTWMDIKIGDSKEVRRVTIGLFGDVVPKTVQNFYSLCKGDRRLSESKRRMHYKDMLFHRASTDFALFTGDYIK